MLKLTKVRDGFAWHGAMGTFGLAGTLFGAMGAVMVDAWADTKLAAVSGDDAQLAVIYGLIALGTPTIALGGAMALMRYVRATVVALIGATAVLVAVWLLFAMELAATSAT
jgi:hypothetical protein